MNDTDNEFYDEADELRAATAAGAPEVADHDRVA